MDTPAAELALPYRRHCCCCQACGVPFDPVYIDKETGAWSAPGFNYMEKRADWQKWLDEKHKKKDYLGNAPPQQQQQQQPAVGKEAQVAEATAAAAVAAAATSGGQPPLL